MIVNLIAELIEPYDGTLYDPCCGSGGMFVQSIKFIEAHHGIFNSVPSSDNAPLASKKPATPFCDIFDTIFNIHP